MKGINHKYIVLQQPKLKVRLLAGSEFWKCAYLTIANIERGATVVRIDTLLKLIEVFDYTIKIEQK